MTYKRYIMSIVFVVIGTCKSSGGLLRDFFESPRSYFLCHTVDSSGISTISKSSISSVNSDSQCSSLTAFPISNTQIRSSFTLNLQDCIDKWLETADFDSDGRISMEEFKLSIAGNSLVDEF